MATGDIVLVKSLGAEPLVRRIYSESMEETSLICTEEEYACWESDNIEPLAVACPKRKIFRYDKNLFQKMREILYNQGQSQLEALWKLAIPYYGWDKGDQR
jgi:hypothetical protein